jgi:CheY-like chemotaxis protein
MNEEQATNRLRILIADDEPLIVLALARVLEVRGHQIFATMNAYEALDVLDKYAIDAAVLDIGMPGGGLRVAHHIMQDADFQGPIVLMTGGLAADTGPQMGPSVLRLQKPFEYPDVIPLVEGGRTGSIAGPSIQRRDHSEGRLRGEAADIRRRQ